MNEDLRYPIGKFVAPQSPGDADVAGWIDDIERLPADLRQLVSGLDEARLASVYRPGGWTVAQVVHHIADSHLNSYTRFKLALTEETPTIRPYDEAAWGGLPDARDTDVAPSLDLIESLHRRWVAMLRSIEPADWDRKFFHPEANAHISLRVQAALYSWHGRHHLAHISALARRQGWPEVKHA